MGEQFLLFRMFTSGFTAVFIFLHALRRSSPVLQRILEPVSFVPRCRIKVFMPCVGVAVLSGVLCKVFMHAEPTFSFGNSFCLFLLHQLASLLIFT